MHKDACKLAPVMQEKRGPGTVATARLNRPADTLAEPHWHEYYLYAVIKLN